MINFLPMSSCLFYGFYFIFLSVYACWLPVGLSSLYNSFWIISHTFEKNVFTKCCKFCDINQVLCSRVVDFNLNI